MLGEATESSDNSKRICSSRPTLKSGRLGLGHVRNTKPYI